MTKNVGILGAVILVLLLLSLSDSLGFPLVGYFADAVGWLSDNLWDRIGRAIRAGLE